MNDQTDNDSGDPQTQFLILCLQSRFDPAALDLARSAAAQDGFDWTDVNNLVYEERLAPLLYATVKELDLLPAQFEQQIRETYLHNGIRNAFLMKELAQVIKLLASIEVDILVLKGAALAETIYNNVAVRPMIDLDILVRKEDAGEAVRLLTVSGYTAADPETHPGSILLYENELLLQKTGLVDIALELHWSLLDSPHYQRKIEMGWFWRSSVPTKFLGESALTLGREALLLHLCSHIMLHHRGQGLLWLHDVAEVLVLFDGQVDWDTLLHKAQEYDLVLSLQRILTDVCRLWNISLPPGVLETINAAEPSSHELKVFNWLTAAERPVAQRFWSDLATSENWRRRLEYAWQSLFPSPGYMRRRYKISPSWLLPFYYPYRWLLGVISIFRK